MTTQADIVRRIRVFQILRGRHSVAGEARVAKGHESGGQWGSQITPAIDAWLKGGRKGDPLAPFSRGALISSAEHDYGLTVPHGVALPALKSNILAAAVARTRPRVTDAMYDPYEAAKREDVDPRVVMDRQQTLIASAIDGAYGRHGLRAKVTRVGGGKSAVVIKGTVHDSSGAEVGEFRRVIERDGLGDIVAYHHKLELRPDQQGTGFASAFNAHLYDWYRESGVTSVHLTANIDVGGFAWALQGYDFVDEEQALDYLDQARDKIVAAADLPAADRRGLLDLIGDMESGKVPLSAPTLATYGRKPGQGGKDAMWPGKWLMLGNDFEWDGQLFL